MLERVVSFLKNHGIAEVVLSLGYRTDAFTDAYPDHTVGGVNVSWAVEPQRLDTAGAIRFAAKYAGIDDTFVVLNGDVLTDGDVSALIDFHGKSKAKATIYLSPVEDPSRFGVVPTDDDGKVIAFIEKPPPGEAPTNLINAGIYVIEPAVLDLIPDGRPVSVERETFPILAERGELYATSDGAYWLDTGTPEAYLQAQTDLLEGRRGTVPASGAARSPSDGGSLSDRGAWVLGNPVVAGNVDGDSLVGDQARIEEGASVTASVIGAGCVVESGAQVSRSVLLAGSRVRSDAVVDRSIIGWRADVGPSSKLTDLSIIGDDTVLAEGTQLDAGRVPEGPPNLKQ